MKTNDDNFIVLLSKKVQIGSTVYNSLYFLKYDNNGTLLWEKEYDFHSISSGNLVGTFPTDLIQLQSGDLIFSGAVSHQDSVYNFIFKTDFLGDSISISKNYEYGPFRDLNNKNNKIHLHAFNEQDNQFILTLNESGELLQITPIAGFIKHLITNQDGDIYTAKKNSLDVTSIRKYSEFGGLLIDTLHNDCGALLSLSQEGFLTAYEMGLTQFDDYLNERWHIPSDQLIDCTNPPFAMRLLLDV